MDLRYCPHCNTNGVLVMSDGRCPNCKKVLVEVSTNLSSSKEAKDSKNESYSPLAEHSEQGVAVPDKTDNMNPTDKKDVIEDEDTINNLSNLYGVASDSPLLINIASSLESTRISLRSSKKRTFPIYLYGMIGPIILICLMVYIISVSSSYNINLPIVIYNLLIIGFGIGIFFGNRVARKAYYFAPLFAIVSGGLVAGAEGAGAALGGTLLPWILYIILMAPPHAQAFFANDQHPLSLMIVEKILLKGSLISRSYLAKNPELKTTLHGLSDSIAIHVSNGGMQSKRIRQLNARLKRLRV